jgi:lactoylglutathione lyase
MSETASAGDGQLVLTGLAHIGIRVHELERSLAFYGLLGFELSMGPFDSEPVAILSHPSGLEINLVINAPKAVEENILMDIEEKLPGYTHVALAVADLDQALRILGQAGHPISGGPVTFPTGARAIFVRDPDRNVVELHEPA